MKNVTRFSQPKLLIIRWVVHVQRLLIIFVVFILSGCIYPKTKTFPINYQYCDIPSERRIELRYVNVFKKPVCIPFEMWPDSEGRMNFGGDFMILIINGREYPIEDVNLGDCFGPCPTHVAPGTEIISFIPYEFFSIPENLINAEKQLDFSPIGHFCRQGE